MILLKLTPEVLSVPVILILMCGIWVLMGKIFKKPVPKPKPRYPSIVNHLLSLDSDQRTN